MTIRLDSTQISTVVLCDECPWWRGFADSRPQGWGVGAAHEKRTHGANGNAANAIEATRSRGR